jgi:elongation factor G
LFEDKKAELIHTLADVDDEIAELFLMEETPSPEQLKAAIKRQTQALKFCPVFMGSAYKNKGVQTLLDGVIDYLPNPSQVSNFALDLNNDEEKIELMSDSKKSLVSLAFKLEKSKYGQLTYLRMYQGSLSRGSQIVGNIEGQSRKFKVPRLVRMHSNEMEDIEKVGPGEIVAMFGVDCPSGTTFTDGSVNYSMTSMFIPDPVVSLAVAPKMSKDLDKFGKALRRFIQEDPTFRMYFDADTNENIVSGMGELHLQIYCERMLREYGVEVKVGAPKVRYQEAISSQAPFDYLLKKQTGGQGQFGRVIGYIEPLPAESKETFVFDNQLRGENIPPQFHISCEKGFKAAAEKGALTGNPVVGVRVVLLDGASHPVDSSDLAFQSASQYAFRQAFMNARPILLQPVMTVEVETPIEFQGEVVSGLTKRKATIKATSAEADVCTIVADVPLADMFGYSSILRSMTEGKGTFSMEYLEHQPMVKQDMDRVVNEYKSTLKAED